MRRVLVQVGDTFESALRCLSIAEAYREAGLEPVFCAYNDTYDQIFANLGVRSVNFYRRRPARQKQIDTPELQHLLETDTALRLYREAKKLYSDYTDISLQQVLLYRSLAAIERIIEEEGIDDLCVWNGQTGVVANAFRLTKSAREMGGGFIERGLLKGGVFFDALGTNGNASISFIPIDSDPAYRSALAAKHGPAVKEYFPALAEERSLRDAFEARKKEILIPLQVQKDSNIVLFSPKMKKMRELLLRVSDIRDASFPDYTIVVRPHPEEASDEVLNLPRLENCRVSKGASLEHDLGRSRIVATINSTVGLEAAINGAIPIVFGEGVYCRQPFVVRGDEGAAHSEQVEAMLEGGARFFDDVRHYLCVCLDKHQTQPNWRRKSTPEGMLAAMAGAAEPAPSGAAASETTLEARRIAAGLPETLRVDLVGRLTYEVKRTYRHQPAAIGGDVAQEMLRVVLNRAFKFQLRSLNEPASGDVAVAAADADMAQFQDYEIVFGDDFSFKKVGGRVVASAHR